MKSNPFTTKIYKSQLHEVAASYRKNPTVKKFKIRCSQDVPETARALWPVDINHREAMIAIFLNRSNNTIGYGVISIGAITYTPCDNRVLFQLALLSNATAFVLVHNHPSGGLQPSDSDRELTDKVKKAGEFLDITLLDHLIISDEGYFSFADQGLL